MLCQLIQCTYWSHHARVTPLSPVRPSNLKWTIGLKSVIILYYLTPNNLNKDDSDDESMVTESNEEAVRFTNESDQLLTLTLQSWYPLLIASTAHHNKPALNSDTTTWYSLLITSITTVQTTN